MQECGLPKQRRLPGWVKAEKEEKEALDEQEKKHQKRSNCETKPN